MALDGCRSRLGGPRGANCTHQVCGGWSGAAFCWPPGCFLTPWPGLLVAWLLDGGQCAEASLARSECGNEGGGGRELSGAPLASL